MSQEKLNRRDLLKMLAAATGAAVLSTVPNKWKTPIVEVGALPAHAQGSQRTGTITGTITEGGGNAPQPGKTKAVGTPLADATVVVDGTMLSGKSGNDGKYTIMNVPVGNRTISCTPPNSCLFPVSPNPDKNVPVTVNATTPATQDFVYGNDC